MVGVPTPSYCNHCSLLTVGAFSPIFSQPELYVEKAQYAHSFSCKLQCFSRGKHVKLGVYPIASSKFCPREAAFIFYCWLFVSSNQGTTLTPDISYQFRTNWRSDSWPLTSYNLPTNCTLDRCFQYNFTAGTWHKLPCADSPPTSLLGPSLPLTSLQSCGKSRLGGNR